MLVSGLPPGRVHRGRRGFADVIECYGSSRPSPKVGKSEVTPISKVFFDGNVFDWFLDTAQVEALTWLVERMHVITSPEVAFEIRNTPALDRRADLEALLALCFPLVPTRLPRAGMARAGLARMATPAGEALHTKLAALQGVNKLDPTHLLNCAAEHCDVFVTGDRRTLNKTEMLETLCGFSVRHPEAFLAECRARAQKIVPTE